MSSTIVQNHFVNVFDHPQLAYQMDTDIVLILLATKKLGSLRNLAVELKTEECQLMDWLTTDAPDIPPALSDMLENLVLGDKYTAADTIFAIGGVEQFEAWQGLIDALAKDALHRDLFDTPPRCMTQNTTYLCEDALGVLIRAGMSFPATFPDELILKNERNLDELEDMINNNHYALNLSVAFDAMINLHCYYNAFFEEIAEHPTHPLEYFFDWEEVLVELAFYHTLTAEDSLPHLSKFKFEVASKVTGYINALKAHAYTHRLPIRAEPLDLLNKNHEEMYEYTEAEDMGLFPPRIHPDIYLDELLTSQRLLHKVLPEICRKMGMTEEELTALAK